LQILVGHLVQFPRLRVLKLKFQIETMRCTNDERQPWNEQMHEEKAQQLVEFLAKTFKNRLGNCLEILKVRFYTSFFKTQHRTKWTYEASLTSEHSIPLRIQKRSLNPTYIQCPRKMNPAAIRGRPGD
jgi:hypothetical protein